MQQKLRSLHLVGWPRGGGDAAENHSEAGAGNGGSGGLEVCFISVVVGYTRCRQFLLKKHSHAFDAIYRPFRNTSDLFGEVLGHNLA